MTGETWRYLLMVEGCPVEISDGEATLGRGRTATIRVEHDSVSRSHALVTLEHGDVTIRDLNSSNGTWIAGRRITGEVPLRDGSRVQLGAAVVVLRIIPPERALSERTTHLETGGGPPREAIGANGSTPDAPPPSPSTAANLFSEIDREALRLVSEPVVREEILLPDLGPRVVATLVDAVILTAMNAVLLSPVFLISYFQPALQSAPPGEDRAFLGILALCGILVFSADLLYTAGLWALRGRTPGKSILKLVIVRGGRQPGDGIGWGPALLRCLVMAAGAIPLFAGWWSAALRKDRRAWHDLAAGTRVVRMR